MKPIHHAHAHPPHSHAPTALPPSLLGSGLGLRLGIAALATALLWITIAWALL